MKLVLLSVALLGICVAGIAIKLWAKKGGTFSGTCASNNPILQEDGGGCGMCGAKPEEKCKMPEEHAAA
jgi:hypothetical protein